MIQTKKTVALAAAGALMATAALAGCSSNQAPASSAASNAAPPAASSASGTVSTSNTASATSTPAPASGTASPATAANTATSTAKGAALPESNAKDIALAHAGLSASAVTDLKCELDYDAPIHYDVEFKANGLEYDYDIDANSGDILTSSSHPDD